MKLYIVYIYLAPKQTNTHSMYTIHICLCTAHACLLLITESDISFFYMIKPIESLMIFVANLGRSDNPLDIVYSAFEWKETKKYMKSSRCITAVSAVFLGWKRKKRKARCSQDNWMQKGKNKTTNQSIDSRPEVRRRHSFGVKITFKRIKK